MWILNVHDMSPDRVCLTNWPRNPHPPPPSACAVLLIVQSACRCRHVGATCLESPRIMQRVLAPWRRSEPSRGGGAVSPCKYQSSHLHPDIYPPPSNEYLKFLTCSPIKAIIQCINPAASSCIVVTKSQLAARGRGGVSKTHREMRDETTTTTPLHLALHTLKLTVNLLFWRFKASINWPSPDQWSCIIHRPSLNAQGEAQLNLARLNNFAEMSRCLQSKVLSNRPAPCLQLEQCYHDIMGHYCCCCCCCCWSAVAAVGFRDPTAWGHICTVICLKLGQFS